MGTAVTSHLWVRTGHRPDPPPESEGQQLAAAGVIARLGRLCRTADVGTGAVQVRPPPLSEHPPPHLEAGRVHLLLPEAHRQRENREGFPQSPGAGRAGRRRAQAPPAPLGALQESGGLSSGAKGHGRSGLGEARPEG